jgi:hypothetical protein
VAVSSTVFDLDELSVPCLLDALRRGGTPEGRYLSAREAVKKQFAGWFRAPNRNAP